MDPQQLQKIEEKSKDLTIKQANWLKAYVETGNGTEAAMKAYDCSTREIAATIASENLRKLNIAQLMEEMGLTKKALLQLVAVGVTKPTKKVQKRVIKTKHLDKDIVEIEYEDVPDWDVRHKYTQDALKMSRLMTNDSVTNIIAEEAMFVWGNQIVDNEPNNG